MTPDKVRDELAKIEGRLRKCGISQDGLDRLFESHYSRIDDLRHELRLYHECVCLLKQAEEKALEQHKAHVARQQQQDQNKRLFGELTNI